eukprot:539763-Prymnesium_polylepis.1
MRTLPPSDWGGGALGIVASALEGRPCPASSSPLESDTSSSLPSSPSSPSSSSSSASSSSSSSSSSSTLIPSVPRPLLSSSSAGCWSQTDRSVSCTHKRCEHGDRAEQAAPQLSGSR